MKSASDEKITTTEINMGSLKDSYFIQCPESFVCNISLADAATIPLKIVSIKEDRQTEQQESQIYEAKNIIAHISNRKISPYTTQAITYLTFDDVLEQKRCDFFQQELEKINSNKEIEDDLKNLVSSRLKRLTRAATPQEKEEIAALAGSQNISIVGPGFETLSSMATKELRHDCFLSAAIYIPTTLVSSFSSIPNNYAFSYAIDAIICPMIVSLDSENRPPLTIGKKFAISIGTNTAALAATCLTAEIGTYFGLTPQQAQVVAPAIMTAAVFCGKKAADQLYSMGKSIFGFFTSPKAEKNNAADFKPAVARHPS